MGTSYKNFNSEDVAVTKIPLYENIPLSKSVMAKALNIKPLPTSTDAKDLARPFLSSFDYTATEAAANHILDISVGVGSAVTSVTNQLELKKSVNNLFAQLLKGYNSSRTIANFFDTNDKLFFISISRLFTKDEIKEGTLTLEIGVDENPVSLDTNTNYAKVITIKEKLDNDSVQYTGGYSKPLIIQGQTDICGYIFYQAGIIVLKTDIFKLSSGGGLLPASVTTTAPKLVGTNLIDESINTQEIVKCSTDLLKRIVSLTFQNTTEINSTIYFCKINHNEFNYSSNLTYTDADSKIRVKTDKTDGPISYITTVGLYSADRELLAVAKLSEPIKKTQDDALILRVRLDV